MVPTVRQDLQDQQDLQDPLATLACRGHRVSREAVVPREALERQDQLDQPVV